MVRLFLGEKAMKRITMNNTENVIVSEALEYFFRKCKAKNLSERTIKTYKQRLLVFLEFLDDEAFLVSDVNLSIVDDYAIYLRETGNRNDVTVWSHMRELRIFLYFCMNEGLLAKFKIKLPKVDKKIKETYTDEELKLLLKKPRLNFPPSKQQ